MMLGKRNDVNEILKASDVFILPTLHENLGNVFLEASSAGIPSIGTNVGGVPEVIEDGITGILVPPYDSDALVDAINKLYGDKELRAKMGTSALLKLNTQFSIDKIEEKFDKMYSLTIYQK
jgi:glycosyltransferase involved in cell wall biosynthesis